MTKGKMVLELLIYAKSAMKNFDQSEASIVVMWLSKEASDLLQIWHIWAILRQFYPWSFFDSGII